MEQYIYNEGMARANLPTVGSNVGIGMLGPALIVHGTDEQKRRYLPPILRGEVIWAQGFSEPGAGSDLASLQTRAVRDGDEYVVNGQKIWTTHGSTDHRRRVGARDQRGLLRGRARARGADRGGGEPRLVRRDDPPRQRALQHHGCRLAAEAPRSLRAIPPHRRRRGALSGKRSVYRPWFLGHTAGGNHAAAPVRGESASRTAAGVRWP